jgi:hypothetical protein
MGTSSQTYDYFMKTINEFNRRVAEQITRFVSTMWCAYVFAGLSLISLPAAIRSGDVVVIVAWVAQTFLQLVLLSIIMVGQKSSSNNVEKMIVETHAASLAEFELAKDARITANEELAAIRALTAEIHASLREKN